MKFHLQLLTISIKYALLIIEYIKEQKYSSLLNASSLYRRIHIPVNFKRLVYDAEVAYIVDMGGEQKPALPGF